MGVATGSATHSTTFKVPFAAPVGKSELVVIANGIASNACVVDVKPFRIWYFPEYEVVGRLIGSLADGPLWVLGPNGPIPVDPMGPEFVNPAKAAYASIQGALKTLRELGEKAVAVQVKEASNNRLPVIKTADKGTKKKAAMR